MNHRNDRFSFDAFKGLGTMVEVLQPVALKDGLRTVALDQQTRRRLEDALEPAGSRGSSGTAVFAAVNRPFSYSRWQAPQPHAPAVPACRTGRDLSTPAIVGPHCRRSEAETCGAAKLPDTAPLVKAAFPSLRHADGRVGRWCRSEPADIGKHEMDDPVLALAVQIVSAHIAKNAVPVAQLPAVIQEMYRALATAGSAPEPAKAQPAVAAKKSLFASHIVCLDCGGTYKTLKRHILADHAMTPNEYRAKWDLPASYPMVAPDYAATRSKMAKEIGLGARTWTYPQKQLGVPKKH
jgi:predicted transcriptional regulator